MKRLTKEICGHAHGAEGISEDKLTGAYCRGEFEATAIVERLFVIEEILGEDYDLERQRVHVKLDCGIESAKQTEWRNCNNDSR